MPYTPLIEPNNMQESITRQLGEACQTMEKQIARMKAVIAGAKAENEGLRRDLNCIVMVLWASLQRAPGKKITLSEAELYSVPKKAVIQTLKNDPLPHCITLVALDEDPSAPGIPRQP
jgi:hypothetical protein